MQEVIGATQIFSRITDITLNNTQVMQCSCKGKFESMANKHVSLNKRKHHSRLNSNHGNACNLDFYDNACNVDLHLT